jgi:hypothetical protein
VARTATAPERPAILLSEKLVHPDILKYISDLERYNERLRKKLKELEEAERSSHRQATPFRRKKKKDKAKHRKPGRKGGHEQARRAEVTPDEEHEAPHGTHCTCGGLVESEGSYEQTQEDLETKKIVRKFVVYYGHCVECKAKVEGRHPFQTSTARGNADHQIGPVTLGLAAELHYGQGVPFDKIREHIRHLGLGVTTSALVRAMDRIAGRGMATFAELLDFVLTQEVLHIDETGWSVAGEPCYLWVLSGPKATLYFVRKTRSSDEVADFLKDFSGILVTDGHSAYDKLGMTLVRALCLLHLRRNARELEEKQTAGGVRFPRALISWLDEAIKLVGLRSRLGERTYTRRAERLEKAFDKLLSANATSSANANMLERLRTWHDSVLMCLRDPLVSATNNHAEQMVRPGVVTRKRGGCNRSLKGLLAFEVITSLLVTAKQNAVDFVEWIVDLLRQPDPLAPAPFW